jgi:hypothetical protein
LSRRVVDIVLGGGELVALEPGRVVEPPHVAFGGVEVGLEAFTGGRVDSGPVLEVGELVAVWSRRWSNQSGISHRPGLTVDSRTLP